MEDVQRVLIYKETLALLVLLGVKHAMERLRRTALQEQEELSVRLTTFK